MALTSLSKHCVITATLLLVLCLVSMIMEFEKLRKTPEKISASDGAEDVLSGRYMWIFYAGSAMSCILMIAGVIRRHLLFMAPWLLLAIAAAGMGIFKVVMGDAFDEFRFLCIQITVTVSVVIFVMLNPFFAVIGEIRKEQSRALYST